MSTVRPCPDFGVSTFPFSPTARRILISFWTKLTSNISPCYPTWKIPLETPPSTGQIGHWLTEKRNVVEDYRAPYGETPERAIAIRMQINSQHTKSVAEVFWRTIQFTPE